eukprot:scaffold6705_cov134-Isochrysis_galbana.AAC.1
MLGRGGAGCGWDGGASVNAVNKGLVGVDGPVAQEKTRIRPPYPDLLPVRNPSSTQARVRGREESERRTKWDQVMAVRRGW